MSGAYWTLDLRPECLISVERLGEVRIRRARQHASTDAVAEEARKIAGQGPQVAPAFARPGQDGRGGPGGRPQQGAGYDRVLKDWVRACKGGAPACGNFSMAGPYTEWLALGAVATHYEGKLPWDNARLEFTNSKDATKWIQLSYCKSWEFKL